MNIFNTFVYYYEHYEYKKANFVAENHQING